MDSLPRPSKTLIYVRVSTKKQEKNFSLATQEKECREYAQRHGVNNVFKCLSDVGSALSMKARPGLRELYQIALDPSNGITDFIFWELDRFTRRIRDFVNITEEMVEAGITLHLASEEEQYTQQNAQAWVLRAMEAQGESAKISKQTKVGQTAATEEGRNIGAVPWGYKIHHEPGEEETAGRLIPDQEVWDDCVRLWELGPQGRTPMQVTVLFNQEGVKAPSGGLWIDSQVRYIWRNRKYTGCQVRGMKHESRLPGPPDTTPPTIIEGAHQAAVSVENFEKIQVMIDGRHRGQGPPGSHTSTNPLSDIAKCGECKNGSEMSNMGMVRSKGRVTMRCLKKKNSGTIVCNSINPEFDILMDRFMERFKSRFLTDDTQRTIMETISERGAHTSKNRTPASGTCRTGRGRSTVRSRTSKTL